MFLATDLSFLSYVNFIFYLILGLAILAGFVKGLKKSLFSLIMMAIFYVIFFVTIDQAVNLLWTMEMPWLGGILGNIDASLNNFTSFEGSLNSFIQLGLGETVDITGSSAEVIALATGLFQFVLKIVWTIVYFTVILLIYKLICLIIGVIFLRNKKEASKNRGFGALVGVFNGLMAVFVMMIVFGGTISVLESTLTLMQDNDIAALSYEGRFNDFEGSHTLIPLAETSDVSDITDDIQGMVDGYNNNIFVKLANNIKTTSTINPDLMVPLHIDLFDKVLSFDYNESTIGIRYELSVFANAASVVLESDFMITNEITELTGDEIRDAFGYLSESKLIVSLVPVAIEVAAEKFETDLSMTTTELYAIDYEQELANIGSIAGALFDILNGAGFIGGEGDVEQITIDGDSVRDIFGDIADSDVLLMITESLLFPMLDEGEEGFSLILTVPDDLVLEDEFLALGEIFAEIIDADIEFSELANADVSILLGAVSEIDLTVLLESQIVTEALINILSGNTEVEGLDILTIPADIVWRDTLTEDGELRSILMALNSFVEAAGDLDFDNLGVATLTDMDDQAINDFFASYIIRATVSDIISETDLGDVPLVIPDSAYDGQGYFTETELISVVKSVKLILEDAGEDFDIMKALDLSDADIDILLASDIIYATIGKEIFDLGTSTLIVPDAVVTTVLVDSDNQSVISRLEIGNIFKALSVLNITDFDTMSFDASIISTLENTAGDDLDDAKILTLLGSDIVHATVSDMIVDLDVSNAGPLNIPDLDIVGNALKYSVGTLDYISEAEISNMLKAMYSIDITDFDTMDLEDTSLLLSKLTGLLSSSIIHATVSEQILGLSPTVTIPEEDALENPILIIQGSTTYIDEVELGAMLDALQLLDVGDPTGFASTFDLTVINTETNQNTLLDSAIMHATISKTLFDVGTFLTIPEFEEDGITNVIIETGSVGNETEFVAASEIKALINAFLVMGIEDVTDITSEISSTLFLDNMDDILMSSSLQATISEQILTAGSVDLVIPDSIRATAGSVNYIKQLELQAFTDALDVLGLSDFDTFTFDSDAIFGVGDLDAFFDSKILQASVSKKILPNAANENTASAGELIIPIYFREGITVATVADEVIVKAELINLMEALDALDFDFSGSVSGDVFGGLLGAEIDSILESGSMHITFNYMLQNNAAITLANKTLVGESVAGEIYDVANVVIASELRDFILAIQLLGGDINGSFTFADITVLTGAQRDVAITSMIVRTEITTDLAAAMLLNGTPFVAGDYVAGSVPQFLLFLSAKTALDLLY
ncbi:hypothetical protein RJI07_00810 [Mycoplasmatota bacterium WC30]